MKLQNQGLRERLAAAAAASLPLPPETIVASTIASTVPQQVTNSGVDRVKTVRGRPRIETVQMTIRPSRALRDKLDQIAIQRAVTEARIITAQEIALEFLERALDVEANQT
jgi:hypothetical protein